MESSFYKHEGKIIINQNEVFLTRNESKLISILYESKNNTVFYGEIISEIWPQKTKVEICTLANLVFHLREKVKASQEIEIITVRSKGYMLRNKKI